MKYASTRTFAVVAALLYVVGIVAPAQAKSTQVAFVMHGRLMVQQAAGGVARRAGTSQKSAWRKAQRNISTTSPDGKYRAVSAHYVDEDKAFRIVATKTGKEVRGAQAIVGLSGEDDGGFRTQVVFDGWLPDSIHFAVVMHTHFQNEEYFARYVVNVLNGKVAHFNGWLSPNGKTAIVPDKALVAKDSMMQFQYMSPHDKDYKNGKLKWFAVRMSGNVASYKANSITRKALIRNKTPFHMTRAVLYAYDYSDAVNRTQMVEFSQNGLWALCHSSYYDEKRSKEFPMDFVVSMTSGSVRKLRGTQAHFVDWAEHAR